jgi:hypothetical protein
MYLVKKLYMKVEFDNPVDGTSVYCSKIRWSVCVSVSTLPTEEVLSSTTTLLTTTTQNITVVMSLASTSVSNETGSTSASTTTKILALVLASTTSRTETREETIWGLTRVNFYNLISFIVVCVVMGLFLIREVIEDLYCKFVLKYVVLMSKKK